MELTPKEKAKEIFGKMYFADDQMDNYPICFKTAKQCALIAVEEIISIKLLWFQKDTEHLDFWKEVKEELLKL